MHLAGLACDPGFRPAQADRVPENDARKRLATVSPRFRRESASVANVRRTAVSYFAGVPVEARRATNAAPDDAVLVQQALAGTPSAFDGLVERYQRRATAVSYRLLGNIHDALEVCQEAFIRAYRNLDSLERPERFGSWLLRIVTNQSLNFRRSRGPRISLEDCLVGDDDDRSERVADADYSDERPGARLAADEMETRVRAGLAQLSPQQRAALVLFSVEQMPQKEVAEILDCSVEAVKWHVFQARKRMKAFLSDCL
jgi:RNA polymerase sigma-70 factor (ECF subfamily)